MAVAAMQGADQHTRSRFWVQHLAQGHFNMQTGGIEPCDSIVLSSVLSASEALVSI